MKTKKTLSVILAVIMLLSCCPVLLGVAFAEDKIVTYNESGEFEADNLKNGYTYIIPSGVTMTVPDNFTLHIPINCTLHVQEGGKLDIKDTAEVIVSGNNETTYGTLLVDGIIVHSENVAPGKYGQAKVQIRFPSLAREGLQDIIRVWYANSTSNNAYENLTSGFTYVRVDDAGQNVYVPLNQYLYIKAEIISEVPANIKDDPVLMAEWLKAKKWDDAKMNVYLNRVNVPYAAEAHMVQAVSAGNITYSAWTDPDKFLKDCRILLNAGTGYTVYGRDGEEGTAVVKWGMPFSFRVEFDEDYQMSSTTADVYIYDGYGVVSYNNDPTGVNNVNAYTLEAKPDASGYYTIPAVKGDYTIYVNMLAIPDEKVTQIGGILQTVRSVFEMIINFFRQIANMFGIGG